MKCPIDDTELMMTERQGIEVDYCPKCRGVWLDRGELDKIIERAGDDDDDDKARPRLVDEPRREQPYRDANAAHKQRRIGIVRGNGRRSI